MLQNDFFQFEPTIIPIYYISCYVSALYKNPLGWDVLLNPHAAERWSQEALQIP